MPVQPTDTYVLGGLQPAIDRFPAELLAVRIAPSLRGVPAGAVMAETTVNANAVHTLAAPSATSGTFTLSFRGYTTTVLNFNSSAAAIAAALNALPSVPGTGAVGTGNTPNNAGSGSVLTWSGTNFTNQPVELPTINVVSVFDVALTVVSTTAGSASGTWVPYVNGGANGSGTAKGVNQFLLSTDSAGMVTFADTATGEEFHQKRQTAPVFIRGAFFTNDLMQNASANFSGGLIDATAAGQLGRLITGSVTAGILRIT